MPPWAVRLTANTQGEVLAGTMARGAATTVQCPAQVGRGVVAPPTQAAFKVTEAGRIGRAGGWDWKQKEMPVNVRALKCLNPGAEGDSGTFVSVYKL